MITTPFFKFLLKVAILSFVECYAVKNLFNNNLPSWLVNYIVPPSTVLNLVIFFVDGAIIYPRYRDPARRLPAIQVGPVQALLQIDD